MAGFLAVQAKKTAPGLSKGRKGIPGPKIPGWGDRDWYRSRR